MAKDINIHVKATEVEQTKQQLDSVGDSAAKIGEQAGRGAGGVDQLAVAGEKTKGIFASFTQGLTSWAASLFGIITIIRLITSAIHAQTAAMQEHARIAAEQQQKLLRLQFLGGFFRERPELRKEVEALSEFGRRPFEEVADAWYNLRSKAGGLSAAQQSGIMREALELGRTDPAASLAMLVDMFSLYAKKTGQTDINRIQNVLMQTITAAGGTTADVASYMPQFLPVGVSGGLSGAQSAGLWAWATTQTAEASLATTGLRAIFMGLQGKGTPESQKILRGMGVPVGAGFFEKIDILGRQRAAGRFGLAQAEQLAGREGAALLLDLLQDPAAMIRIVKEVSGVDVGNRDIVRDMIRDLMGKDEFARQEEENRHLDIEIENIKGSDARVLRGQRLIREREISQRRRGMPEYFIGLSRSIDETLMGFGAYPSAEYGREVPPVFIDKSIHNITQFYPRAGPDDGSGPRYKH